MICENIYTYTFIYAVNVYVMCVFFRLLIFIRLRIEAGRTNSHCLPLFSELSCKNKIEKKKWVFPMW